MSVRSMGARLEAVAERIAAAGPFSCLCDIGSDHAYLPIRVLKDGSAASAVAADLREGPLEKGRQNAAAAGVFPEFIRSDGFERLDGYVFDAVSLCGLGGETIADILDRGKNQVRKDGCLLFLQPMTAHDDLRKYLWESGFSILSETFVLERGRPYVILTASYTGTPEPYRYSDLFLGRTRPDTPAFAAYARKTAVQTEKRMRGNRRTDEDSNLLAEAERLASGSEQEQEKQTGFEHE